MQQGVWRRSLLAFATGVGYAAIATAAGTETLPEDGYLGELPVVLSVTRLAQSLADTPAAVTVIDRDMIRRSGARNVYELLRFVPGFVVSGWNGANPIANYHMRFDEYGARLQVFVDGRSVYSSLYLGDTHRGLSAVPMEDIERIEVLRGSNSAAYGANAFLGVINIVTRNSADTRGTLVSVNLGSDGISDQTVRYGWGTEAASFRISASRRADDGFKEDHVYPAYYNSPTDDTSLNQMHFRGDLRPSSDDEVQLELGGLNHRTGEGTGALGNAPFTATDESNYLMGRWTRQLSPTRSVSLSASFDDETLDSLRYEDGTKVGRPIVPVDTSGRSQRAQVEFSMTQKPSETVRTVWGSTWRRESATSRGLFDTDQTYAQTQLRLFGNVEWRLASQWLLNAGGLLENNSVVGTNSVPRLMLNWQPTSVHTFRIGATKATRTPSLFELYGNNPVRNPIDGTILTHKVEASGNAKPEQIYSQEIGYLGDFRDYGIALDVRVFKEQIRGVLTPRGTPNDYVNAIDSSDRGFEYQLQWRPRQGSRILLAGSHLHITPDPLQADQAIQTPNSTYSAAWFQDLPRDWEMALMYWHVSTMTWRGATSRLPAYGVTNVRIAKHLRFGRARSEIALTVQDVGGDHYEFIPPSPQLTGDPYSGNPIVPLVQRRAFLTLRTEF